MLSPDALEQSLRRAVQNVRQASSDFDLNPELASPEKRTLKPAAVLVAVSMDGQLILTKRSAQLKHHAGQIAFAGGRKDDTDRDLAHTALREAHEEIGLRSDSVQVIGTLPNHETVTNYAVTPVVGLVPSALDFVAEPGEVAEVFTVPLAHVLNTENYAIEGRWWRGQKRQYYVVPFGPYYIWGATARILRGLAEGAK
ncbi:CoA pyrophosphatase [Octadecabacter sp. 1_MG-2023]|uniref:CoA pyrophosphatase n=1 Tax=unclassified Octadecabacter TaxID=196158 RepID=UPI001C084FB8|nr:MULTISPECIES: CoA pyrophosphatase [unclassified Octadecabacter]MBU2992295.1 CoA pyrophosphatase [Octadecabacter sp. B2R22]MDO6734948.1 CoA pyrophosphatase [Octadecabacter sp. 1_MG-2023]